MHVVGNNQREHDVALDAVINTLQALSSTDAMASHGFAQAIHTLARENRFLVSANACRTAAKAALRASHEDTPSVASVIQVVCRAV